MKLKQIISIFIMLSCVFLVGGCTMIYVVRHGKTMLNEAKRAQGWADAPLTDEGVKVTKKLAHGFKKRGIEFDYAYSSDLGRTRQTTGIILKGLGQSELPLREQQGLREVCFGTYEGEKFHRRTSGRKHHAGRPGESIFVFSVVFLPAVYTACGSDTC